MPELVRLVALLGSLFSMWFISAGLILHVVIWGLYGLEVAWSWLYPDLLHLANHFKVGSSWLPGGGWVNPPSWKGTVELTVMVAAVMSVLPVVSYIVLPLRAQVKAALGAVSWAMTFRVKSGTTLHDVFMSVKRKSGVRKPVSLYLVKIDSPLAFAMGAPFRGTVVLSEGLVKGLAPDEVYWVMAHELAHIRYRDMMLGALWISSMRGLNWFERIKIMVINLAIRVLAIFRTPVFLIKLVIGGLNFVLSILWFGRWVALKFFLLVDRWVSRQAEFRADRFAAKVVGVRPGARALHRLGGVAEPLFNGLFATHPKTSARIKRLCKRDNAVASLRLGE